MAYTTPARRHRVVTLVYDRLWPLEFGIAAEVFGWERPELDLDWYDFRVAAPSGTNRAMGGFSISSAHGLEITRTADTIIIPGWRDADEIPPDDMLDALTAAHKRGARLMSYCTGAFVLAQAGLLDGRQATTHWSYLSRMKQKFPDIDLVEDVLYVDSGNIITSAGSSAAIDASLYVIRQDYGSGTANKVARSLVAPPHRDGGQSQYIEAPVQERPGRSIAGVHTRICCSATGSTICTRPRLTIFRRLVWNSTIRVTDWRRWRVSRQALCHRPRLILMFPAQW